MALIVGCSYAFITLFVTVYFKVDIVATYIHKTPPPPLRAQHTEQTHDTTLG